MVKCSCQDACHSVFISVVVVLQSELDVLVAHPAIAVPIHLTTHLRTIDWIRNTSDLVIVANEIVHKFDLFCVMAGMVAGQQLNILT
jgi:hypothetical protein